MEIMVQPQLPVQAEAVVIHTYGMMAVLKPLQQPQDLPQEFTR